MSDGEALWMQKDYEQLQKKIEERDRLLVDSKESIKVLKAKLEEATRYPQPALAVDVIVGYPQTFDKILLVKRKNPPYGWALPGGFVDRGESLASAAIREVKEETGIDLDPNNTMQFHAYSAPDRDPRKHVVSVAYGSVALNSEPRAGDDAAEARWFRYDEIEGLDMAFDHLQILKDASAFGLTGIRPRD